MIRPLAVDLFCGLGGWTEGLLAEGYMASAMIAKIPLSLAQHIAAVYRTGNADGTTVG